MFRHTAKLTSYAQASASATKVLSSPIRHGQIGAIRDTDRLGPMQHRHGMEKRGNEAGVSCTTDS